MRTPVSTGMAAAAAAAVLWGAGTIATAAVLRTGVPPGPFTVVELVSSVAFLAVLCWVTATPLPSIRRRWRAGALGLLEPGATYLLINLGLARTSATHGALIGAAEPILIALIAWAVLGEAISRRLVAPMAVVLVGTIAVVTAHSTTQGASWTGDALVALGILSAAFYVVGSSRVVADVPVLGLTLLQQIFALSLVVPVVGLAELTGVSALAGGSGPAPASLWPWVAVPLIGIGASSLTFLLYLTALRHIAAGVAAQFLALVPLVAFTGAVLVLDEPAGPQAVVGAVVVVAALLVIARIEQQNGLADRPSDPAVGTDLGGHP